MKSKITLLILLSVTTFLMSSCGSGKSTTSKANVHGESVQNDICQDMAEEKPMLRAAGNAQHFQQSTARNLAEAQARAEFARRIAAQVKSATTSEAGGISLYAGDDVSGQSVTDQTAAANDLVESIAKEVIRNVAVIKTSVYKLPNNQFNVFVCLEYQGGINEMAQDVTKQLQEKISDEQKMKIKFDFDQYRNRIEKELSSYKGE